MRIESNKDIIKPKSGKPLKTRGSGTLAAAGIPCLLFGRFANLRESAEGGHF